MLYFSIIFCLILQEVLNQICATLFDYPCLRDCTALRSYIDNCVNISWGLSSRVRYLVYRHVVIGEIPSIPSCCNRRDT